MRPSGAWGALVFLLLLGLKAAPVLAAPVLPEEKVVEGEVVECAIVASELLGIEPPMTLYRLQVAPDATADEPRTILSKKPLPAKLFGQRVRARAVCLGDEWGNRCWLEHLEIVN